MRCPPPQDRGVFRLVDAVDDRLAAAAGADPLVQAQHATIVNLTQHDQQTIRSHNANGTVVQTSDCLLCVAGTARCSPPPPPPLAIAISLLRCQSLLF